MKKTTIAAADFQKKTYAQPQMKVAELDMESLICQSPSEPAPQSSNEEYEEESTSGWFNN